VEEDGLRVAPVSRYERSKAQRFELLPPGRVVVAGNKLGAGGGETKEGIREV